MRPIKTDNAQLAQPLLTKRTANERSSLMPSGSYGNLELTCLFTVCMLEGADTALLPSALYALQRDLGLTLQALAMMSMGQAVAACAFAPVWGIMADRRVAPKRVLLVTGCIIQGLVTATLARIDALLPLLILRIINGAALASLGPISKSMLAESVPAQRRGRAFSLLTSAVDFGRLLGFFCCIQLASREVLGMQGWRVAFMLMGSLAVFAGVLAFFCIQDREDKTAPSAGKLGDEWLRLRSYMKIATFWIIVIQGCFGSMPWCAFGYNILFFQTAGLSINESSALVAAFQICCMLGQLVGGVVGDTLELKSPGHGRAFTAQISVFSGIPLVLFMYLAPSTSSYYFLQQLLVVITTGFLATWCASGVNAPILCEIVDVKSCTSVMAWESALEGSFASFFGNMSVGLLGQLVFGYHLPKEGDEISVSNKTALGRSLAVSTVLPWLICFAAFSMLHKFYPRDRRTSCPAPATHATTYGVLHEEDAAEDIKCKK